MTARNDALILSVQLLEPRWHGADEWPPSPFRLFQALVAAAARGSRLAEEQRQVLAWLEALPPPSIGAPRCHGFGEKIAAFVPNNDLDGKNAKGNILKLEKIRTKKQTRPRLLLGEPRFHYLWELEAETPVPEAQLAAVATRLYQFGRGIDMAWARLRVMDAGAALAMIRGEGAALHRPCREGGGDRLAVPRPGSLDSLCRRHRLAGQRFTVVGEGRRSKIHFRQPPKPLFRTVGYACPPHRRLFDLLDGRERSHFAPVARTGVADFVARLRDRVADRLLQAGLEPSLVDRFVVGRGAGEGDKPLRMRIVPLPSIGHRFAGGAIRRVLVEVPQNCPLAHEDLFWAFDGLDPDVDPESGETPLVRLLVPGGEWKMAHHYGVDGSAQRWRTVTPAVLPAGRGRGAGRSRIEGERRAVAAVRRALRHAGIDGEAVRIRVRKEPFERTSAPAPAYRSGRFDPHRLWHVDILFDRPQEGPLIIGDGRYLGLGIMAPAESGDLYRLPLEGEGIEIRHETAFIEAARKAMIAVAGDCFGRNDIEPFFHGHETDGGQLRPGHHAHLFLHAQHRQGRIAALCLVAPWRLDREADRAIDDGVKHRLSRRLEQVATRLATTRIYAQTLPPVRFTHAEPVGEGDELLASSRRWRSASPYLSTRHPRSGRDPDLGRFLERDVLEECLRRGLPRPRVEVISARLRKARVQGEVRLHFGTAQPGPLLLGWNSHRGRGRFLPE